MDEEEKTFLTKYFDSELKGVSNDHRTTDFRVSDPKSKLLRASDLQDALKRRKTQTMITAVEKIKKQPYSEAIKELKRISTVSITEKLTLIVTVCKRVDENIREFW